jgi:hypothetical protein
MYQEKSALWHKLLVLTNTQWRVLPTIRNFLLLNYVQDMESNLVRKIVAAVQQFSNLNPSEPHVHLSQIFTKNIHYFRTPFTKIIFNKTWKPNMRHGLLVQESSRAFDYYSSTHKIPYFYRNLENAVIYYHNKDELKITGSTVVRPTSLQNFLSYSL